MSKISRALVFGLAPATLAAAAVAGPLGATVIIREGGPVPGLPGANFGILDRPFRSPDGNWWAMNADTTLPTTEDEVIIRGFGAALPTVMVREGTAAAWTGGENVGLMDRLVSLDNSGDFVFVADTNGPTTADEYLVKFGGGGFSTVAQEGTPFAPIPGANHGAAIAEGYLTSLGVAYRTSLTSNPAGTGTTACVIGGTMVVNTDNVGFVPSGQAGGATETWDILDLNDFYVSSDGLTWMQQGDLNGATTGDDVLVVNNAVVIQEDSTLSGFGSPVNIITESVMMTNGDWFARGSNDDTGNWLLRNGVELARTGDSIPGGLPGEVYSDALFGDNFFTMTGNNLGDFVIGGTTSNADPLADAVLVFNNSMVVARQGDPVDLDGNGMFDDNAFINIFNNEDAFLTDNLQYFFTADLMDGTGSDIGQAFMVLNVPAPGAIGLMGLAGLAVARRRRG